MGTDDYHLAVAVTVGQHAAEERQQVNYTEEGGECLGGPSGIKTEIVAQEQDKDGQHRVVAEPLAGVG